MKFPRIILFLIFCVIIHLLILEKAFCQDTNSTPELIPFRKGDKWGYCNRNKEVTIPCQYDYAGLFSEGLAVVRLNKKYGFIDKKGKEVIPITYDYAYDFSEGLAEVGLINKKGYIKIIKVKK